MVRRPHRRFALPIVAALAVAGVVAQQKPPAAAVPNEAAIEAQIAQLLVAFARTADSNKMPVRARAVFQQVLDQYDRDHSAARAALGWRRVQGEWRQPTPLPTLPAETPTAAQRKQVDSAWAAAQKRIAALHRDLGLALLAADQRPRGIAQLERAIAFDPVDKAARRALGHRELDGFFGTEAEIAFVQRMRAIRAKVAELAAQEPAVEGLPASAMPEELRRSGLALAGAASKHFEHWYGDDVAAAVTSVRFAEVTFALLQFLVGGSEAPQQPDAKAIRWWVVLRTTEQVTQLLDKVVGTWGHLTREQAGRIRGQTFQSQRGGLAEWTLHAGPDGDMPVAHVAMRCLGQAMCPGFAEGFTHAVAWWTTGTIGTQYSAAKPPAGGADDAASAGAAESLATLREEVAAGTAASLPELVRAGWDGLDARLRRRGFWFMAWLVARHPDRWLQLGTELYVDDRQPEQVAATLRRVLGRELAEVDAEWQQWVRSGSPIGRASGLPQ